MNNDEQLSTIKEILEKSIQIAKAKMNLIMLKTDVFRDRPTEPKYDADIEVKLPEIKPKVEAPDMVKKLSLVMPLSGALYNLFAGKNKYEEEAERIRNSPEYRKQCEEAVERAKQRQSVVDEKNQALREKYEEKIQKYEAEFKEWSDNHKSNIEAAETTIKESTDALRELYEKINIISAEYREIPVLQFVYDIMSKYGYNAEKAIEIYENHKDGEYAEEDNHRYTVARWYSMGDEEVNRYTDFVVADIKKALGKYWHVDVYGGSTNGAWYEAKDNGTLKYPNVLVKEKIGARGNVSFFVNEDKNGNQLIRSYSMTEQLFTYAPDIYIYGRSMQDCNIMADVIDQLYVMANIKIPDPLYDDEKI